MFEGLFWGHRKWPDNTSWGLWTGLDKIYYFPKDEFDSLIFLKNMTLRTWVPSRHPISSHPSLSTTCIPIDGYDSWPKYFKGPLLGSWLKIKGDLDLSGKVWLSSIVWWKNYLEKNCNKKNSIWVWFSPPFPQLKINKEKYKKNNFQVNFWW